MPTWALQRMPPSDLYHDARKGLTESVPSGTNPRVARRETGKRPKVTEGLVDSDKGTKPPKWSYREHATKRTYS